MSKQDKTAYEEGPTVVQAFPWRKPEDKNVLSLQPFRPDLFPFFFFPSFFSSFPYLYVPITEHVRLTTTTNTNSVQTLRRPAVIKKTVSHGDISSLHIEVRWPHLKSFGLLICGFFGSIITQVIFSSIIHCFTHGFGEEAEVIRQDIMLHDMGGRYVVVGARDRRVQEDSVMLNLPYSVASALVLLLVTKCV